MIKRIPIHPLFIAAYPVLALYSINILEVDPQVILRPLTIAVGSAGILLVVFGRILKDWKKAGLLSSFLLFLFFSYGHLYQFLEQNPIAGINLGRHRYLLPVFTVIIISGLGGILRRTNNRADLTLILNLLAIVLVIIPLTQIGAFFLGQVSPSQRADLIAEESSTPLLKKPPTAPDIYYIILDAYTRGDALQSDFDFDNSSFLNDLQATGFYVANCSRSNYSFTQASLTSTLNFDYLTTLQESLATEGTSDDLWDLLKHSRARSQLERIGYQTVAFETGYEWSRISDAAFYLEITDNSLALRGINPFEALLIKTTLALALTNSQIKALGSSFESVNYPFSDHINRQRFILNQLKEIPNFPGPKFVFVHLLIPHNPFVFAPDGTLLTDPGFFGGKRSGATDDTYRTLGYTYQVQYINTQILGIVRALIEESSTPPIIILQGDHGLRADNRFKILNAYYLAGEDNPNLYPSITPVNTFRLVFNHVFWINI